LPREPAPNALLELKTNGVVLREKTLHTMAEAGLDANPTMPAPTQPIAVFCSRPFEDVTITVDGRVSTCRMIDRQN